MPTYVYECGACNGQYETEQRITADSYCKCSEVRKGILGENGLEKATDKEIKAMVDRGDLSLPPKDCDGAVQRIIQPNSFVLNGGGWYQDGYTNSKKKKD